jgi:hypothetical protein
MEKSSPVALVRLVFGILSDAPDRSCSSYAVRKKEAKEDEKMHTPSEWGPRMGKKGGKSGKKELASALVSSGTPYGTCVSSVNVCCFHMSSCMSLELNERSRRMVRSSTPLWHRLESSAASKNRPIRCG